MEKISKSTIDALLRGKGFLRFSTLMVRFHISSMDAISIVEMYQNNGIIDKNGKKIGDISKKWSSIKIDPVQEENISKIEEKEISEKQNKKSTVQKESTSNKEKSKTETKQKPSKTQKTAKNIMPGQLSLF